jgi:mycothiol S-conjugate amidase
MVCQHLEGHQRLVVGALDVGHRSCREPKPAGKVLGDRAAGLESPYEAWLERFDERPDTSGRITTRVPCADYFPVRDDALRAHATQVDPDGRWFHVPMEIQQQVWPTEDYELARSMVERTGAVEDDLFAGIREAATTCR